MQSLHTSDSLHALNTLTHNNAARLLVTTTDPRATLEQALTCLLSTSWCRRLLVLTPASAQAEVLQFWPQLALGRVPTQLFPTVPEPQARICVTTVRALQVQQSLHGGSGCRVESVLIYRMPRQLSPVWKLVLERFGDSPIIGVGTDFSATTMAWFEAQGGIHARS